MIQEKQLESITEEYAQMEMEKWEQWERQYGTKIPELCIELDKILGNKTKNKLNQLKKILEQDEIKTQYVSVEEIAAVTVAVRIAECERQKGEMRTFLERITTIKELERYFQKIRLCLYRLEFSKAVDAEEELLCLLREEGVTVNALIEYILIDTVHPMHVAMRIERLFCDRQMHAELLYFGQMLNMRWPGNSYLHRKLSQIYLSAGTGDFQTKQKENILELNKIAGEIGERVQEELWFLRYGDTESVEELVRLIREIGEIKWRQILEIEQGWKTEGYLVAANALMELEQDGYAWILLEEGDKSTNGEVNSTLKRLRKGESI